MRKYMIFCSSLERVFGWNGSDTRWQFCNDCYDIFDNGTQPMSIRTFTKHDALPHNSEYVVAVLQAEFRNHFRHLKKCGIKGKRF